MGLNKGYLLVIRCYFKIFNFLAYHRLRLKDLNPQKIHAQLITVLASSTIMWYYTILALFTFSNSLPGMICLLCSLVHLLTLGMYRFTRNAFLVTNILLLTGLIEVVTFSYYSEGFLSFALTWLGIFPMLAGISGGKKQALHWFGITLIVTASFMALHLSGYTFPNDHSSSGYVWGKSMIIFGFLAMNTLMIALYGSLTKNTEKILQVQTQKIDDLFRVLFHDLANPLGRLTIGLSLASKRDNEEIAFRGLEISTEASNTMLEITQNIRKIYAVRKGKTGQTLVMSPLNASVEYIQKIYAKEIIRKDIQFIYNYEKNYGLKVWVEPVSFNNQVLGNIFSNAIKFSNPGDKIYLNVYPLDQLYYTLEIHDFGIGMSPQILENLYELNKKTSRPGTLGETGTGFGMYIMKSYVEMFEGRVEVESNLSTAEVPSGTKVKLFLQGEWK